MKDNYIHSRTAVYNLNYHIVWCIKYRRSVLNDSIIARLQEILKKVGQEKGFTVVLCNVGDRNHIHCFAQIPPKISVTNAVRYMKGISGRLLLKEFPEIQKDLWKGNLWNDSYFVESIGSTSEKNIKKYIERQKVCQG